MLNISKSTSCVYKILLSSSVVHNVASGELVNDHDVASGVVFFKRLKKKGNAHKCYARVTFWCEISAAPYLKGSQCERANDRNRTGTRGRGGRHIFKRHAWHHLQTTPDEMSTGQLIEDHSQSMSTGQLTLFAGAHLTDTYPWRAPPFQTLRVASFTNSVWMASPFRGTLKYVT